MPDGEQQARGRKQQHAKTPGGSVPPGHLGHPQPADQQQRHPGQGHGEEMPFVHQVDAPSATQAPPRAGAPDAVRSPSKHSRRYPSGLPEHDTPAQLGIGQRRGRREGTDGRLDMSAEGRLRQFGLSHPSHRRIAGITQADTDGTAASPALGEAS